MTGTYKCMPGRAAPPGSHSSDIVAPAQCEPPLVSRSPPEKVSGTRYIEHRSPHHRRSSIPSPCPASHPAALPSPTANGSSSQPPGKNHRRTGTSIIISLTCPLGRHHLQLTLTTTHLPHPRRHREVAAAAAATAPNQQQGHVDLYYVGGGAAQVGVAGGHPRQAGDAGQEARGPAVSSFSSFDSVLLFILFLAHAAHTCSCPHPRARPRTLSHSSLPPGAERRALFPNASRSLKSFPSSRYSASPGVGDEEWLLLLIFSVCADSTLPAWRRPRRAGHSRWEVSWLEFRRLFFSSSFVPPCFDGE